jgi:formylglycine-generating enzyme required for sulfatase activity
VLNNLRRKQIQRIVLGLNDVGCQTQSDLLLLDDMVYYKPFANNLGVLRMTRQDLKPINWYMSHASKSFLYKEQYLANGIEFSMLLCPKGSFMSPKTYGQNENKNYSTEGLPQREVNIESSFFLGETEITRKFYHAIVGGEPRPNYHEAQPITCSWWEAVHFCNTLSDLYGLDRCYTPCKNVILFRYDDPKSIGYTKDKRRDKFYNDVIAQIKNLGIENVYFDTDVDDDTLINNPFYFVHGFEGTAGERFEYAKERLNLRPSYNFAWWQNKDMFRMTKDLVWKIEDFVKTIKTNPKCDPTKNGYRLPMEKEWEYAARTTAMDNWAGTNSAHNLGEYARIWDNRDCEYENGIFIGRDLAIVKSKRPNRWGFYDMLGNVSEYCNDVCEYDIHSSIFFSKYGSSLRYLSKGGDYRSTLPSIDWRHGGRYSTESVGFRIARTDLE